MKSPGTRLPAAATVVTESILGEEKITKKRKRKELSSFDLNNI